ncbi:hypothetical protein ACQ9AR_06840 [Streptomyces lividans]|nr:MULTISPECIES: hypothetical protein [Streptomyces]
MIKAAQRLGFTLEAVAELLEAGRTATAARGGAPGTCCGQARRGRREDR